MHLCHGQAGNQARHSLLTISGFRKENLVRCGLTPLPARTNRHPSRSSQRTPCTSRRGAGATDPSRMSAFGGLIAPPQEGLTHPPEGTYLHARVGGPRAQQCGDARTWSKRQPGRCWELQADRTVVCGTQAWVCNRASLSFACVHHPRCTQALTGAVTRPAFRTPFGARKAKEDRRTPSRT